MNSDNETFFFVVDRIIEVVMFENWLRFYFIEEMHEEGVPEDAEPKLFVIIPEKAMHNIKALYPDLYPLAEKVNNQEITLQVSQNVICTHVVEQIDGVLTPRDSAQSIMDSATFSVQLQLFHTWLQLHEDQLEAHFVDFGTWQKLFAEWKDSKPGQELTIKLMNYVQTTHQEDEE